MAICSNLSIEGPHYRIAYDETENWKHFAKKVHFLEAKLFLVYALEGQFTTSYLVPSWARHCLDAYGLLSFPVI